MNKEDKYSLGYAICNSIQDNKDKIEKLENQLKRCRRKKEQVENKCDEYKYRIEKAIEYIEHERFKKKILLGLYEKKYQTSIFNNLLEILKGEDNE